MLTEAFLSLTPCALTSIVNISSLAAVRPFPTLTQYSTWKAAREMYLQCVAEEFADRRDAALRTLSFAPGPMETDMTAGLGSNPLLSPQLRAMYAQMDAQVV